MPAASSGFLHGPPAPLIFNLPCPPVSPFELYRRVASVTRPSFLLESGKGTHIVGRYSFFGTDPYEVLSGTGRKWTRWAANGERDTGVDPFASLARRCLASTIVRPPGAPPFFGGAVGYFSYDLVRQFETLPSGAGAEPAWPDLEFGWFDVTAAVDHDQRRLLLSFCPPLERFLGEPREKLYHEGRDRLAMLEARLLSPVSKDHADPLTPLSFVPQQTRSAYMDCVLRCKEYIAAGDIYQANLSHRFAIRCPTSEHHPTLRTDLQLYGLLRITNPSPFSGLLRFGERRLISSSPERLVRLDGGRADTRPIAGTRPRGNNPARDRDLADELCTNDKERAEHLMLVDLERNDLGRVCEYGSVRVDDFMTVEQYSHVTHLVSNVSGILRTGATGFDLFRAMFPGGTITGVPKIRCMEIIDELEPARRGPYTGSMGYLCWSGDLDFNILIRTLALYGDTGSLQVGAGIVADSDPGREYEETLHKAQAFFSAFSG